MPILIEIAGTSLAMTVLSLASGAKSMGGGQPLDDRSPAVPCLRPQFLLNAQKLIVFRSAIRAGERSCLDLSTTRGDCEIRDGRILGFTGSMRHDTTIGRLVGHLDRRERLRQRPDLVDLDQDRIAEPSSDPFGEPTHIGDEEVVANELAARAERAGQ